MCAALHVTSAAQPRPSRPRYMCAPLPACDHVVLCRERERENAAGREICKGGQQSPQGTEKGAWSMNERDLGCGDQLSPQGPERGDLSVVDSGEQRSPQGTERRLERLRETTRAWRAERRLERKRGIMQQRRGTTVGGECGEMPTLEQPSVQSNLATFHAKLTSCAYQLCISCKERFPSINVGASGLCNRCSRDKK